MKIAYKYMGKWHTVVRLDNSYNKFMRVNEGQIIESDLEPSYFLQAWFIAVDLPKKADLEYAKAKMKADKILKDSKKKKVSKSAKVKVDVKTMKDEEIKAELDSRGVKYHRNLGRVKLEKLLIDTMIVE